MLDWLRRFVNEWFCGHCGPLEFVENIYGEQIYFSGGYRSLWRCRKCGGIVPKKELY